MRSVFACNKRLHLCFQTTFAVINLVDDVCGNFVTAIGKDAICFSDTQWCCFTGTKRHRQAGRDFGRFEAETLDVLLRVSDTDGHQDSDGNHVFRGGQCLAQGDIACITAV